MSQEKNEAQAFEQEFEKLFAKKKFSENVNQSRAKKHNPLKNLKTTSNTDNFLPSLYSIFEKYDANTPLVLESNMHQIISSKLDQACSSEFKDNKIEILLLSLKVRIWIYNHAFTIDKKNLTEVNWIPEIIFLCITIFELYVKGKDFDNAKKFSVYVERLLNRFSLSDELSCMYFSGYYVAMTQFAFFNGCEADSKKWVLKLLKLKGSKENAKTKANFGFTYSKFCKYFAEEYDRKKEPEEMLFWVNQGYEFCMDAVDFISSCEKGERSDTRSESIKKQETADNNTNIDYFDKYRRLLEFKIFLDKKEAIINFITDMNISYEVFFNGRTLRNIAKSDEASFFSDEQKDSGYIKLSGLSEKASRTLFQNLKKEGIVCVRDKKSHSIVIYNLVYTSKHAISKAFKSWKNAVEIDKKIELDGEWIANQAPLIMHPPVDAINAEPKIRVAEKNTSEIVKSCKLADEATVDSSVMPIDKAVDPCKIVLGKTPVVTSSSTVQNNATKNLSDVNSDSKKSPPPKEIKWSDRYPTYVKSHANKDNYNPAYTRVFRTYGSTAVNNYLFIKEELLEGLSEQNKHEEINNLLRMCDRGKVLGNSIGKKGILIKGDKVEIKDASKDYRFFGHTVASVKKESKKDKKPKTLKLMVIDSYKAHHNDKTPVVFKETISQKCSK